MPAALASSVTVGFPMREHSQIANLDASRKIRNRANAFQSDMSQSACMTDCDDKNGGPNHLKAWMRFRRIKGAKLAEMLDVTPGMISDLANSNRALSAKWLRRIAPALQTTPGMLLDHDPFELDGDIIDIWINASSLERKQLTDVAKVLVLKDGTIG